MERLDADGALKYYKMTDDKTQDLLRKYIDFYLSLHHPSSSETVEPCDDFATDGAKGLRLVAKKAIRAEEELEFSKGLHAIVSAEESDRFVEGFNSCSFQSGDGPADTCVLLGPIAFCNHSCTPNTTFQLRNGYEVLEASTAIAEGDEILVDYGGHYFQQDNALCLCPSCKADQQKMSSSQRDTNTSYAM